MFAAAPARFTSLVAAQDAPAPSPKAVIYPGDVIRTNADRSSRAARGTAGPYVKPRRQSSARWRG